MRPIPIDPDWRESSVKYLPLIVITAALGACANPMPSGTQSVGTSQQPVGAVAQCIAQKWADRSQQQVVTQTIVANNQAADVYMPGQQPPNGGAAIVRPAWSSSGKTWVGVRAGPGGADSAATGDISACL
jgi:hypothetical protein